MGPQRVLIRYLRLDETGIGIARDARPLFLDPDPQLPGVILAAFRSAGARFIGMHAI